MNSLTAMAEAEKTRKKSSAPKKELKKVPTPTYKSNEFIGDSDADNNVSDVDSESDENEEPTKPLASIPVGNGKVADPSDSESESESGTSSDAQEDSSSEEETDDEQAADSDSSPAIGKVSVNKSTTEPDRRTVSFKTAPYKPPTGFEQGKFEGASKASELFKKTNLEGKQIWYFTAPVSVPISSIKSMSLLDAKNGNPVLEHNGGNYAFLQDSAEDKTYTKIMVPNSSDDGYKTASRTIDHIFHLQQIVKLSGVVDDAPTSNHSCGRVKKPARPQPKGLKMRFRPLGFGSGHLGDIGTSSESGSDQEMEDTPAVQHITAAGSKSASKKKSREHSSEKLSLKRKHTDSDGKKSKNSSSSTTEIPHNKKLKLSKKTKTESQINKADSPSASTNIIKSSKHKWQQETTAPLPKSSQISDINGSYPSQSSQKSRSKKRERHASLESLTSVTGPDLTSKEQRKKMQQLKNTTRDDDGAR